MSVFRQALGVAFEQMHPTLQLHYDPPADATVTLRGVMETWNRFPLLRLALPFAPLNAARVEVVVRNRVRHIAGGALAYEWQREFRYPGHVLSSHTLTRLSPLHPRDHVMDCFPPPFATAIELSLSLAEGGAALVQQSTSYQYALLGRRQLRLPVPLQVRVSALERTVGEHEIETEVTISHVWLGRLFGYRGRLALIDVSHV